MPQLNYYILFITAAFPIILGAVYFNPKVMGKAWLSVAGLTADEVLGGSMVRKLLLTYLFGLFMSYVLFLFSVHQSAMYQLFLHEEDLFKSGSELNNYVASYMAEYGDRHRTFGHGVLHGMELCLLMGLGMIGITALNEQRPMKYMWIHVIFWVLCGGLMGGVLCAFV